MRRKSAWQLSVWAAATLAIATCAVSCGKQNASATATYPPNTPGLTLQQELVKFHLPVPQCAVTETHFSEVDGTNPEAGVSFRAPQSCLDKMVTAVGDTVDGHGWWPGNSGNIGNQTFSADDPPIDASLVKQFGWPLDTSHRYRVYEMNSAHTGGTVAIAMEDSSQSPPTMYIDAQSAGA
jgi:hypothetical protein